MPDSDPETARTAVGPDVVIVMGVSGSGKTTVAKGISTVMGWEFAEGDAFHSEANVAKMASRPAAHRRGPLALARVHRRLDQRQGGGR